MENFELDEKDLYISYDIVINSQIVLVMFEVEIHCMKEIAWLEENISLNEVDFSYIY